MYKSCNVVVTHFTDIMVVSSVVHTWTFLLNNFSVSDCPGTCCINIITCSISFLVRLQSSSVLLIDIASLSICPSDLNTCDISFGI